MPISNNKIRRLAKTLTDSYNLIQKLKEGRTEESLPSGHIDVEVSILEEINEIATVVAIEQRRLFREKNIIVPKLQNDYSQAAFHQFMELENRSNHVSTMIASLSKFTSELKDVYTYQCRDCSYVYRGTNPPYSKSCPICGEQYLTFVSRSRGPSKIPPWIDLMKSHQKAEREATSEGLSALFG